MKRITSLFALALTVVFCLAFAPPTARAQGYDDYRYYDESSWSPYRDADHPYHVWLCVPDDFGTLVTQRVWSAYPGNHPCGPYLGLYWQPQWWLHPVHDGWWRFHHRPAVFPHWREHRPAPFVHRDPFRGHDRDHDDHNHHHH